METASEHLQALGFSQYEAQAYIALLRKNPLNGYELAKESGIPRANIYLVLQKLEDRGAVLRQDSPDGTHFAPVAPEELLNRLHSHFDQHMATARTTLDQVNKPLDLEQVWSIRGYLPMVDHAMTLVQGTERDLLLAVWPQEAAQLEDALTGAETRGVKITTLCLAGCAQPCGSCRGEVHRETAMPETSSRWLVVVPDQAELLTGEIDDEDNVQAVRTKQRLLVSVADGFIRYQLALATIVLDLSGRLNHLLTDRTKQALLALGLGAGQKGWLEHMKQILSGTEESNDDRTEA